MRNKKESEKKTGKAKGVRSHEESEIGIISKHVSLKRQIKEVCDRSHEKVRM